MSSAAVAGPDAAVDQMARAGARNVAAAVVSAVSGVAVVLVVTNVFPKATSGTLFASTSLFLVVVSVCLLGTDVGLARWVPRYLVAGRPAAAERALRVAAVPVAATSAVLGLALVGAAPAIASFVADDASNATVDDLTAALRVLGACLPVAVLYEGALAAARAHGAITPTIVIERLGRSLAQVAGVAVVGVVGGGAIALVVAWSLPYVVALVAAGAWLVAVRRRVPPAADEGPTSDVAPAFWRFTTPRAVGQVLQVALQRVDIVLVSALLGVGDAAVYTAATRFLVFGQIGTQAVQQVLQPQLDALLAADDVAGADRLFRTATAWIMAMAWPIYLSFAAAAPVVMGVFGDGYDAGTSTVLVLSLAMLFATAAGPVDVALLMSGRSGTSTVNGSIALAVDVGLLLLLVPHLGIIGAAFAWAAAIVVRNLLPLVQVRGSLGITSVGPATATVAVVVAAPFAVVAPLVHIAAAADRPEFVALVPVALVVALAGLWATRERTGLTALLDSLRRRSS